MWRSDHRELVARVAQLENELERLTPGFGERLEKLERALSSVHNDPPRGLWHKFAAWFGEEGPKFVTALVLLILGYWIKDSVDEAIKRQQLQLDFAKQMQSELDIMSDASSDKDKIERAATLVAAYGAPAILPLINELRHESLRAEASERGLGFIALADPAALCDVLPRVLMNRTGQFGWNAHLRIIRLTGEAGCNKAKARLEEYLVNVRSAHQNVSQTLYEFISDRPSADQFDQLEGALNRSILIVSRQ